eukprot:1337789-Pleurochrysis_carterae.AAC.2
MRLWRQNVWGTDFEQVIKEIPREILGRNEAEDESYKGKFREIKKRASVSEGKLSSSRENEEVVLESKDDNACAAQLWWAAQICGRGAMLIDDFAVRSHSTTVVPGTTPAVPTMQRTTFDR